MSGPAPRPSQRSPSSFDTLEPRKPSRSVPYTFPVSQEFIKISDALSGIALCCDALCMLTRFAMWGWLGLLLSIAALRTAKTLTAAPREGSSSFGGTSCALFSITALSSIYLPLLQGVVEKAPLWSNPFQLNGGLIQLV